VYLFGSHLRSCPNCELSFVMADESKQDKATTTSPPSQPANQREPSS
jgi:hypothetical protein